jgi:hypothetical protein
MDSPLLAMISGGMGDAHTTKNHYMKLLPVHAWRSRWGDVGSKLWF